MFSKFFPKKNHWKLGSIFLGLILCSYGSINCINTSKFSRIQSINASTLIENAVMKPTHPNVNQSFIHFLYETGMLGKLPRMGNYFLCAETQTIAAHQYRTAVIGVVLAELSEQKLDLAKLLLLCLFHDYHEARTRDFNNVQKKLREMGF